MQFRFHFAPLFLRIHFSWTDLKSISSLAFRDEAFAVLRREKPRKNLREIRPWKLPTWTDPRYGVKPEPWLKSSKERGLAAKSGGVRYTFVLLFGIALAHLRVISEQPISKSILGKSKDQVFFNDVFISRVIKRVPIWILSLFKGSMDDTARCSVQGFRRQR